MTSYRKKEKNYNMKKKEIILIQKTIKTCISRIDYYLKTTTQINIQDKPIKELDDILLLSNKLCSYIYLNFETSYSQYALLENVINSTSEQFILLVNAISILDSVASDFKAIQYIKEILLELLDLNKKLTDYLIESEKML